jgi:hypothetical protein
LLPHFEKISSDERPRLGIASARSWAAGEVKTGFCQKATVAAHAAAHTITDPAAIAVARACGHAAATAHMADHSLGVLYYGKKAVSASGGNAGEELAWQISRLPAEIRELVISGHMARFQSNLQI